ncbi:MAG: hypothetical protein MUC92_13205 [Fimbriimonadaceae bacterium]|nr:hypothetical protein [Fimbriimonadaceae bacterium]
MQSRIDPRIAGRLVLVLALVMGGILAWANSRPCLHSVSTSLSDVRKADCCGGASCAHACCSDQVPDLPEVVFSSFWPSWKLELAILPKAVHLPSSETTEGKQQFLETRSRAPPGVPIPSWAIRGPPSNG